MGVTMGHWHLNSVDVEANKKIFAAMGGNAVRPATSTWCGSRRRGDAASAGRPRRRRQAAPMAPW